MFLADSSTFDIKVSKRTFKEVLVSDIFRREKRVVQVLKKMLSEQVTGILESHRLVWVGGHL